MAATPFPPVGARRLVIVSILVLGLGAVACGAGSRDDSLLGAANVPDELSVEAPSGPDRELAQVSPIVDTGEDIALGLHELDEIETAVDPSELELSPLATQVVPLAPAFPERVLPGLADPVGFAPVSVSIPDIGIDTASIVPVGLEENGELEVPGADSVGWYRFGAGVDGGRGSAVLAAHIAYNGRDGVFRDLADLTAGETIVVDRNGSEVTYQIREVSQFGKFDLPIDELFRESGDERLVLITCGGSFNPSLRSYDDNVVVIAYPVV